MQEVIRLWGQWQANPNDRAGSGFGPFKDIFIHLRDVRRWDVRDRLDDGRLLDRWREELPHRTGEKLRFEMELWYRSNEVDRERAKADASAAVRTAGGRVVKIARVDGIRYLGVLAELPAEGVEELLKAVRTGNHTDLLKCEEVMFFRPRPQTGFLPGPRDEETRREVVAAAAADSIRPPAETEPVVALFDGLPVENHDLLDGRIVVDAPDGWGDDYPAEARRHGTAMASLILHGDLNDPDRGGPLPTPLYVRPILKAFETGSDWCEEFPRDELMVDLIHTAVRRMKVGDAEDEAAAPGVRVVNLSIGDADRPFLREMSPLARLLDWLASEHDLLFVVSVGNHQQDIELNMTRAEWEGLVPGDRAEPVLRALEEDQRNRRPIMPAESVNAVTVGSHHSDHAAPVKGDRRADCFADGGLPTPLASVAAGRGRAVKPEILMPGGRAFYTCRPVLGSDPAVLTTTASPRGPGLLTAAPGVRRGDLGHTEYGFGSSNAAALASRLAGLAHEKLAEAIDPDLPPLPSAGRTVLLKALLVHGASWEGQTDVLERVFGAEYEGEHWSHWDRLLARYLGFGLVNPNVALFCTGTRVTAVAAAKLAAGDAHVYQLPLPPSFPRSKIRRRVTATLAWNTPINVRHRQYRKASLWLKWPNDPLRVREKVGLGARAAELGTVEHVERAGDSAVAPAAGTSLTVQVNCREDAGGLNNSVWYGLAVTLDVAEPLTVDLYEEMREAIVNRVRQPVAA
ncbi:S8 family peptidase [Alienimonas californiensis]|uniref:S8 family peptidase n=1 Tax=Alienimonas californiensis TaxID=2527989 RepID=UPI0013FCFB99|nr:S8 family peptidase [Alienimonas californiensis]